MAGKWIQKANVKKGALHRSLGIKPRKKIPSTLLNAIVGSHAGQTISNPTGIGKRRIHVTSHLEHQAIFAQNVRKIRRR